MRSRSCCRGSPYHLPVCAPHPVCLLPKGGLLYPHCLQTNPTALRSQRMARHGLGERLPQLCHQLFLSHHLLLSLAPVPSRVPPSGGSGSMPISWLLRSLPQLCHQPHLSHHLTPLVPSHVPPSGGGRSTLISPRPLRSPERSTPAITVGKS